MYFTSGEYDFLVVSEMPDAQAASILSLVAAGGGSVTHAVTTQAFTTAEAKRFSSTPARSPTPTSRWVPRNPATELGASGRWRRREIGANTEPRVVRHFDRPRFGFEAIDGRGRAEGLLARHQHAARQFGKRSRLRRSHL